MTLRAFKPASSLRQAPPPRTAFWAVSFVILAFSVALALLPPALVKIKPEMGLTTGQAGQLSGVLFAPFLVMVFAGSYASRFVPKGTIAAVGCAFLVAGCAAAGMCRDYSGLMAAAALLGMGSGLIEPTAPALIGGLWEGRKRTAAMNYSQVSFAAGSIGIPVGMAALIAAGGNWRAAFWAGAAVCSLSGLWMVASGTVHAGYEPPGKSERRAVLDGFALLLIAAMFAYVAAEVSVCYWLPSYFQQVLNAPDAMAAATNGVFWTGAIVGRLAAGYFSKTAGDVWLLRFSAVAGTLIMLLFWTLDTPATGMAATALIGLAFACIWPTILSYAGHVYGARLGQVFPWIIAAGAFGAAAGPVIGGGAAARFGQHAGFLVNPIFFALISLIVIAAPGREKWARPGA